MAVLGLYGEITYVLSNGLSKNLVHDNRKIGGVILPKIKTEQKNIKTYMYDSSSRLFLDIYAF